MRVLLAIDGSPSSDIARDLVADIAWPEGSTIRVLGAVEHSADLFGLPWMPMVVENADQVEAEYLAQARQALAAAERKIAGGGLAGRAVDSELVRGHPGRMIVDAARTFGAELIVVGSHGHGGIETALLGSTSSEVVDHAPCPVLVARSPRIESIVLADDGSDGAAGAAACIDDRLYLRDIPVTVVSVAETALPWAGAGQGLYELEATTQDELLQESRADHFEIARRRAEQLGASGRRTQAEVRNGDPAAEIIAAAEELQADLIVLATRGHTGLTRMILGSVARKVLTRAGCSVLVARAGVVARPAAAARVRTEAGVAGSAGSNER